MSKSTKIVAGLGVAAALGVAALPMATFADDYGTHTVTVNAEIGGSITAKAKTDTTPVPTSWETTGTINFNGLSLGQMVVNGDTTVIDVETNYPNGYSLTAAATALANNVTGGGSIALTDGITDGSSIASATTTAAAYSGGTSIWGVRVTKTAWDYTASPAAWASSASSLSSGSDYSSSDFVSKASGTIDATGAINSTTRNKYDIEYGIGITSNQAAGTYSGTIAYTVTATDYTAPTPPAGP